MVGNVHSNPVWTLDFDLAEIDVTASNFSIDQYLKGVEYMLNRSIAGASLLGSLSKQIDIQTNFTHDLMDSINEGVSRLVDANMEEASAKLAAQQTQQQLTVQALQIANSSAGTILQLYSSR